MKLFPGYGRGSRLLAHTLSMKHRLSQLPERESG